MYTGNNKTALTSIRNVIESMLELMKEKKYSSITICELCDKASVSRQTFYTLFGSKENVIIYTLQSRYGYTISEMTEMMSMSEFCRLYSQYIVENKDYIKTLFDNGISYLLYDSIYTAFNESCCDPSCTAAKKQYLAHFLAGGISGVVNGYVSTGCMTPKDELENILIESFSGNMFR